MATAGAYWQLRPYYGAPWMDSTPRPVSTASLLEVARRLGPRPYSERGPNPAPVLPSTAQLVGWMVDAIDAWWVELGCPDPFTWVDIGAGDGTRAEAFLGAGPACLTALRGVLVEADPVLRDRQRGHLPIESPIFVLGPVGPGDGEDGDLDDEEHTRAVAGIGPLITSLPEPPVVDGDALVVAIGWVGRLPSDRLEWRDGRWWEIRLAAGDDGTLSELPIPLDRDRSVEADRLFAGPGGAAAGRHDRTPRAAGPSAGPAPAAGTSAPALPGAGPASAAGTSAPALPGAGPAAGPAPGVGPAPAPRAAPAPRPDGARYAVLAPAVDWLAGALRIAGSGRLAVIDRWTEVTGPLAPGEVPPLALDQLAAVRRPIEPAPVPLFPEFSMVTWRLG